jgi:hypothetical protein
MPALIGLRSGAGEDGNKRIDQELATAFNISCHVLDIAQ